MGDRALDSTREHMYGIQEAARYLGVHRSTLHLAVRQGLIVPDERTPGRHVRFSKETLNRFREHLASGSVTGEEAALAPLRAHASVAHLLATHQTGDLAEIGAEVVKGVCNVLRGVDMCCVVRCVPELHEQCGFRLVAQHGLPDAVVVAFKRMKANHRFAVTTVLRTRQPEIREDVAQQHVHSGTAWLSHIWPIGAYAVLPIVAIEEPLGILICVSQHPRHFGRQDMLFLQSMADLLAVALDAAHGAHERPTGVGITPTMQLMRLALDLRTGAIDSGLLSLKTPRATAERISPLVDAFLDLSGAQDVCALGFDTILPAHDPRLAGLACGACAEENAARVLHEVWDDHGTHHTALATAIPLSVNLPERQGAETDADGVYRGAVVAHWEGTQPAPEAEDLLVSFACAYLLALS
ncbi:MAG: GAF domain-containing protein [Ktedonobacterales bacterium]